MRKQTALLALIAFASFSVPAAAQLASSDSDAQWLDNCRSGWGNDDRGHACEVRQVPLRLSGRALDIDSHQNGSIRVQGWEGDSVRVTARMQASARSDEEARRTLSEVRITADGRAVRAEGPSRGGRENPTWATSYVVFVPHRFDLSLTAHNGSLRVTDVRGRMELRTQNGSLGLTGIGGDVHARTQNGSVNVQLGGTGWDGSGLDAETQNGSVRLNVPERYAATLETGTVNGRINTEIPITVRGRIGRRLSIPMNGGGATIRAITTNGSVSITTR